MKLKDIKRVRVADLREWDRNPRKIEPRKFEDLVERIRERGFNDVLKVAADGVTVIGGNHRLRALRELDIKEVDVLLTGDSTPEDMLKTALSDNQEFAEYDVAALRLQLEDMPGLDLTGYELNLGGGRPIIDVLGVTEKDDVEDDFDIEEALTEEAAPLSKRGTIYQLGDHRLMCGDSTSEDDLARLMDGKLGNLVFTDPPYMVDYHSSSEKKFSSKDYGGDGSNIANDNLDGEDAIGFYVDVLDNLYKHTTDNAPIYWWYAATKQFINGEALRRTGWYHSQNIIWVKEQFIFSMGQDFHRMHEPVMFGWKKGNKHFKARRLNNLADTFTLNPEEFADIQDVWLQSRDKQKDYVHPTQKPVALSVRGIRVSSLPGDIVIDLFGGSGSTLMGAERLSRKAYLMELDPKFVDAIRKRWARFMHGSDCDWQSLTPPIAGGSDG